METSNQENFKWADRVFQRVIVLPTLELLDRPGSLEGGPPRGYWGGPEIQKAEHHRTVEGVQGVEHHMVGLSRQFGVVGMVWKLGGLSTVKWSGRPGKPEVRTPRGCLLEV